MADVTERMLALLATLQSGRSFSGPELAERLGVSGRTLRRDISRLRGYGYPVRTQPGPGGHYLLAAGTTLPPLTFDDDEAVATLVALAAFAGSGPLVAGAVQDAATRAYATLDQFLPARLRPRLSALRASLETSTAGAPAVNAQQLAVLGEAIAAREIVTFAYTDARQAGTERRVEPYRHVHHLLRWYLLGWDLRRQDWRVFRLDRVENLRRTAQTFAARALPAESALAYLRQGLHRDRSAVTVLVEAPVDRVVDALRYEDADVQPLGASRTRLTVRLDSWQWFVRTLALLDADFRIESGTDLADELHTFGKRLLRGTRNRAEP